MPVGEKVSKQRYYYLTTPKSIADARSWWRLGRDTQQIADNLDVTEAAVYNSMHIIRGELSS
jgi:hypothetical protein